MTHPLQVFLYDRMAEDRAEAYPSSCGCLDAHHVPSCMPTPYLDRPRRELAAKRVILTQHEVRIAGEGHDGQPRCHVCTAIYEGRAKRFGAPCPTLLALAAVYRDHPDYQKEWEL